MAGKLKPIPDGYHSVTPYLTVHGAARLLEFLKRAFDATIAERQFEGGKADLFSFVIDALCDDLEPQRVGE